MSGGGGGGGNKKDIFNSSFATRVSISCYEKFNQIPKSGKPVAGKEWTLLAAIVKHDVHHDELKVVSLATGSKCLGSSKMSELGDLIHDSHAEVLARRAFLRYLYEQIHSMQENGGGGGGDSAECLVRKQANCAKYDVKNGVTFHLFTSHVPCGDASIFPKFGESDKGNGRGSAERRKRKLESAAADTPLPSSSTKVFKPSYDLLDIYRTGAKCLPHETRQDKKLPGAEYHTVGAVRTKPGRGEPTLSVSCSDKILRWNLVGIQGALLSLLLEKPVHLSTVVVGSHPHLFSEEALKRAVIERIPSDDDDEDDKVQRFPVLLHSEAEFPFSKRCSADASKPSPCAIVWCDIDKKKNHEVYVDGRRLGWTKSKKKGDSLLVAKKTFLNLFNSLTNNEYSQLNYGEIKMKAIDYQNKWRKFKTIIGVWTVKDDKLNKFRCS